MKLSCTFKSTSHSSTVYFGDSTQDEMCFAFVSYYPAHPFVKCVQIGDITMCHNKTNSDELGGCTLSPNPTQGGTDPKQRATFLQLGSKCDTTGKTCTSDCLSLLTENPHPCFTGDAKRMGEIMLPRALGPNMGKKLQSASRSCDIEIYDSSTSSAKSIRSIFSKITLMLVGILVVGQIPVFF